jgi:hypothetical protein
MFYAFQNQLMCRLALISTSSRTIQFMSLAPAPIRAFADIDTPGPICSTTLTKVKLHNMSRHLGFLFLGPLTQKDKIGPRGYGQGVGEPTWYASIKKIYNVFS